jgi:NlpC/P60 family putative phage cell wall peptidase
MNTAIAMHLSRSLILTETRRWIGTPYHHQASVLGAGVDCIGLVRGIYRALYGHEPEAIPGYSRDWAEASGDETLLAAATRHLIPIETAHATTGDVLIFRWRAHLVAKHAAILASPTTMIHALEGAPVSCVALSPWWRRRIAAAFAFPGVSD